MVPILAVALLLVAAGCSSTPDNDEGVGATADSGPAPAPAEDDLAPAGNDGAPAADADPASDGLTRPLELTDPLSTPPVDTSQASVDLATVVFDTFDGGSITLAEADGATIARLFDAIRPIDTPSYSDASAGDEWLDGSDLVVGYVDSVGRSWAYPVKILNSHEIVNDELSGQPILISYCPLCGSGVVFDRRLGDRTLSFSNTSALHQNDMVMVDRETGSYWWQLAGRAIVGGLDGETLTALPAETTNWHSWRSRHPDTRVMDRPGGGGYERDSFARIGSSLDQGRTPFPVDPAVFEDDRLSPSTRVIIVEVDGERRAYPTGPARAIDDTIGGTEVTVTADGVGATAVGPDGALPARFSYWYAALAAYPDISVGS
ncbi:MAG: DUF3179 domain-containing (seleno)protein [Acidimicrobiales bacterium]